MGDRSTVRGPKPATSIPVTALGSANWALSLVFILPTYFILDAGKALCMTGHPAPSQYFIHKGHAVAHDAHSLMSELRFVSVGLGSVLAAACVQVETTRFGCLWGGGIARQASASLPSHLQGHRNLSQTGEWGGAGGPDLWVQCPVDELVVIPSRVSTRRVVLAVWNNSFLAGSQGDKALWVGRQWKGTGSKKPKVQEWEGLLPWL